MTDLKSTFLGSIPDKLREQGFVVILLLLFGYLIWGQNDTCNKQREVQYEQQIELLQTIIKDNTRALDQNSETLRMIQGQQFSNSNPS